MSSTSFTLVRGARATVFRALAAARAASTASSGSIGGWKPGFIDDDAPTTTTRAGAGVMTNTSQWTIPRSTWGGGFAHRAYGTEGGDRGEGEDGDAGTTSEEEGGDRDGREDAMETEDGNAAGNEKEDGGWVFGVKNQRRPTRRDKGSYDGFLTEIDSYPTRNDERDLYNMSEWVEASLEESKEQAAALVAQIVAGLEKTEEFEGKYGDLFAKSDDDAPEEDQILTWTSEFVLEPGDKQDHPLNWKVSLSVKLGELQRVTGLSDEALEYIKLLVDKRYNPKQDLLRIVCRRSNNREHNRQWCLKVLYDLIQEGNREYPSDSYSFKGDGLADRDA
jgi:hypothetical protein